MKETPYSNIEKKFLKSALLERKRLDGRQLDERRRPLINFSKEYGCCHVSLGDTRVFAQVSSEIQQPKSTRPNEGFTFINVEFSPMAAQHIEPGKPSEACVIVTRFLEKCIRESKCIDLESLCIIAEEKVWVLRVDLTVLNIEGNVVECASIAALAALAHFRRPDVTSTGDRVIVHDASEKELIPTTLHHFPVCLTYAIFNKGNQIVADPTLIEEETAEASLSIGMNAYRELCGIHLGGKALSDHNAILKVVQKAGKAAADIVQLIKQTLADDEKARANGEVIGLSACIKAGKITTMWNQRVRVKVNTSSIQEAAGKLVSERHQNKHIKWDEGGNEVEVDSSNKIIVSIGENSAELRDMDDNMEESSENDDDEEEDQELDEKKEEEEEEEEEEETPLGRRVRQARKAKRKKKVKQTEEEEELPLTMRVKQGKEEVQKVSTSQNLANMTPSIESEDELEVVQELSKEDKERLKHVETLVLDDSEEEEVTILTAGGIEQSSTKTNVAQSSIPSSTGNKTKKKNRGKKRIGKANSKKSGNENSSAARSWYPPSKKAW